MLYSEAKDRKVVSTSTAETVGRIEEFIVDPAAHAIIALALKKSASGDILRWAAITAFGTDAVTVANADLITPADPTIAALSGKGHRLIGGLVLSTLGDELGKVADVDFDPETGLIVGLHLADQHIDGIRLVGIGRYAVVVQSASS